MLEMLACWLVDVAVACFCVWFGIGVIRESAKEGCLELIVCGGPLGSLIAFTGFAVLAYRFC